MAKKEAKMAVLASTAAMAQATQRPKPASWLQTTLQKIRKREASADAMNWGKVLKNIEAIPLADLEVYIKVVRKYMREAVNPVDHAIYRRLFRKLRNVIEYRKVCLK